MVKDIVVVRVVEKGFVLADNIGRDARNVTVPICATIKSCVHAVFNVVDQKCALTANKEHIVRSVAVDPYVNMARLEHGVKNVKVVLVVNTVGSVPFAKTVWEDLFVNMIVLEHPAKNALAALSVKSTETEDLIVWNVVVDLVVYMDFCALIVLNVAEELCVSTKQSDEIVKNVSLIQLIGVHFASKSTSGKENTNHTAFNAIVT